MVTDDPYSREFAMQRAELDARAAQLDAQEAEIAVARQRLRTEYEALDIAEQHYRSFLDRKSGKIVSLETARPAPSVVTPTVLSRAALPGWRKEVKRIVLSSASGLTNDELKAEIRKTFLNAELNDRKSARNLYTAIYALRKKGEIRYHNSRVFSPAAFEKFKADVAAGLVEDERPVARGHFSPMGEAILEIAARSKIGLRRMDFLSELETNPIFAESLAKYPSVFYNAMAHQIKRGKMEKIGDVYRLASPKPAELANAKG